MHTRLALLSEQFAYCFLPKASHIYEVIVKVSANALSKLLSYMHVNM